MNIVAQSNSPYLIRLLLSGKSSFGKSSIEYLMVQEYCPVSLFALMQQQSTEPNGSLSFGLVLKVIEDIASGLAVLHGLGIVHRDVKPENILQQRNNCWCLVDFGSAIKGTVRPTTEATRAEVSDDLASQTTLTYRAPEMLDLFRGLEIGPPSDIWALGCTFYYAMYLVHPFRDEGELAILNGRLKYPHTERNGAPQMNALISTLLRQDPSARPVASEVKILASKCALGIVERTSIVTPRGGGDDGEKSSSPREKSTSSGSPRGRLEKGPRKGSSGSVSDPITVTKVDVSSLDPELQKQLAAVMPLSGGGGGGAAAPRSPRRRPPPPAAPIVLVGSDDFDGGGGGGIAEATGAAGRPGPPPASAAVLEIPLRNHDILEEAKNYLVDVKALVDPEMWRMEISPECVFPHPRDLVIRSWQVLSSRNHSTAAAAAEKHLVTKFCALFRSRDKGGDFVIKSRSFDCLQMLGYFHALLQSGSFMALARGQHTRPFLEEVAADNDHSQGQLVRAYALFLADRLALHAKHHIFEGNMSLGTYEMIMFLNRSKTGDGSNVASAHFEQNLLNEDTVKDLLVLLAKAVNLQAMILSFKQHANIIPFIIPVVKETYSLATIICHCARHHWLPYKTGPSNVLLDPLNRTLGVLANHFAEVSTIPLIVSSMGPPPPLLGDIPDPRDATAPAHPFYVLPLAYPPSHSPFVISFEKQRSQLAVQLQASQQQAEALFPASFDASAAPQAVPEKSPPPPPPPSVAVASEFEAKFQEIDAAQRDIQAKMEDLKVTSAASPHGDAAPTPPLAPAKPVSVVEKKMRKKKLRVLSGTRRNSVKDIAVMRESGADAGEKRAAMVAVLQGTSREDLIEEILFLRKKVASLETQLGEAMSNRVENNL